MRLEEELVLRFLAAGATQDTLSRGLWHLRTPRAKVWRSALMTHPSYDPHRVLDGAVLARLLDARIAAPTKG